MIDWHPELSYPKSGNDRGIPAIGHPSGQPVAEGRDTMAVRLIGGLSKGRLLHVPKGSDIRPTSGVIRRALFSMLTPFIEGAAVLDLFAGTGALGIEAISRGASTADFIEQNPRQCAAIRGSLSSLGYSTQGRVRALSVQKVVSAADKAYDLIFLDPPYKMENLEGLLENIADSKLISNKTVVAVEHPSRNPLKKTYGSMGLIKERRYGDGSLSIYQNE